MQGKKRKTRVLPFMLAAVLSISVNTTAIPLMGYAAEVSTSVNTEEEPAKEIEEPAADLNTAEQDEAEPAEEEPTEEAQFTAYKRVVERRGADRGGVSRSGADRGGACNSGADRRGTAHCGIGHGCSC